MAEKAASSGSRVVVVALDGSEFSQNAFHWYKQHVHRPDDFVIAVHSPEYHHCLSAGHERPDIKQVVDQMEQEQQKKNKMLEGFSALLSDAGMTGKVKSVIGNPGEVIVRIADEENASMIITGARGIGKIRRTLLGSVSDYIVHHSHVPVTVCRR
ncbi:universal stress protein YxiE-like [Haliotis asinina]|uniref:universal stress protein YxiE-like n=1 Tax=Haliotis asinina TaxID=109174 RepID=UPI003531E1BD